MDGMREIRFFSKALFVGFKPRKESLLYVFNSIPYCGSEDISWGAVKIHSLKYHFQMIGTGYSYHPALFL